MDINDIIDLITNTFSLYGSYVMIILASFITIGVAYQVFKFGWRKVQTSVGGTYEYTYKGRYYMGPGAEPDAAEKERRYRARS